MIEDARSLPLPERRAFMRSGSGVRVLIMEQAADARRPFVTGGPDLHYMSTRGFI